MIKNDFKRNKAINIALFLFMMFSAGLAVYGENLTFVSKKNMYDLSDCRLSIGLVKQNDTKDLLLNSEHVQLI